MSVSDNVVTYEEQILTDQLPGSIIIGGSGAIGVEFAYVMTNFGVDVTIVEFLDRMVPDRGRRRVQGAAQAVQEARREGAALHQGRAGRGHRQRREGHGQPGRRRRRARCSRPTRCSRRSASRRGSRATASRRPASSSPTAARSRSTPAAAPTSTASTRSATVTGKLMLAHTAEAMGVVAAETIAGAETMEINFDMIPRATFCQPQIASFGYSEAQAKEKGYDVKVATFPFSANGKARGMAEGVGFVKIVADAEHNEILGAHMIGPEVTELLPALTLAQQWDLTADEVARNVFAHPTLSRGDEGSRRGHRRPHDQPLTWPGRTRRHRRRRPGRLRVRPSPPAGAEVDHRRHRRGRRLRGRSPTACRATLSSPGPSSAHSPSSTATAFGGSAVLTDCVPSKTLIATAELMTDMAGAAELGVDFHDPEGDAATGDPGRPGPGQHAGQGARRRPVRRHRAPARAGGRPGRPRPRPARRPRPGRRSPTT